jgi:hypothetical protein
MSPVACRPHTLAVYPHRTMVTLNAIHCVLCGWLVILQDLGDEMEVDAQPHSAIVRGRHRPSLHHTSALYLSSHFSGGIEWGLMTVLA